MKGKIKNKKKNASGSSRLLNIFIIFLNFLLLSGAFMMYARYNSVYRDRLREENLGNIVNLNRSAATNITSIIGGWNIKLDDIANYVKLHDMTVDEALEFISDDNSDESRHFELIGEDYKGFLAKRNNNGSYLPLDYSSQSYGVLQKAFDDKNDSAFDDICFAPEFTDNGETALKFFAIYKHMALKDESGVEKTYTLLLAVKSKDVLSLFNSQNDFEKQSTVLIDSDGDYIVSNNNFKSTNFYQYLYIYNDLTLDQKNLIISEMKEKSSGELYYKNAGGIIEDCVYRYERMSTNGWYCVTCVPISSFRTPIFNTKYIVYAVVLASTLFLIDLSWLRGMNRRLSISVKREREANMAKGNFMSRMSHEIRTPLNAVIGYNTIARSEMSEAKTDTERKQAEMKVMDCLMKSDIASKHLLSIINDVLDMSAIESGKIKIAHDRFDFKGLITSLTTIFYSQAKAKNIEFNVIFDTMTEEWFVGDQMRTNQVLTNLLSNAVKFTPENGSVTLKICQPEASVNASHIHFEIIDTGIGMSEEYLGRVWAPFEQADSSISRRFGGTGLGLSITKNLVDIMGGEIKVESKLGKGTKFSVDLIFGPAEQPKISEIYDFSEINALVVDDDLSTCDYIRLLFNRCGARCVTAASGRAAVKAVNDSYASGEKYTVCLVDWRMPEMDGIDTIKEIRKIAGKEVPIIVLTAYDYTEIADKAAELGVSRFIAKPLFQSSLFDLLAGICGNKQPKKIEKNKKYNFAGARVLLAEDNAMNMEIAKKIMESAGLTVDNAWNGEEVVNIFKASPKGTYMAVLMDVHMPVMNGFEATHRIRSSSHPEAKTIPIIAMTADAFAENVAEAIDAGMNDHVSKPIDVAVLFDKLDAYYKNK